MPLPRLVDCGFEMPFAGEVGAEPMLVLGKRFHFRLGCGTVPFQGLPAFITALSEGIALLVFDMGTLLEQGIALKDLPSYAATSAGASWLASHCNVVALAKGASAFVPAGKLYAIAGVTTLTCECPEHVVAWTLPAWHSPWVKALPDSTWKALQQYNQEHHSKATPAKVWAPKAAVFDKFMASLS